MTTIIRKLFWISPVIFLVASPLSAQEDNRRGRIVIDSQEIATWTIINNSFADPDPQWEGVLIQMGDFGDTAGAFHSVSFKRNRKEVMTLSRGEFTWINIVSIDPTKRFPMDPEDMTILLPNLIPPPAQTICDTYDQCALAACGSGLSCTHNPEKPCGADTDCRPLCGPDFFCTNDPSVPCANDEQCQPTCGPDFLCGGEPLKFCSVDEDCLIPETTRCLPIQAPCSRSRSLHGNFNPVAVLTYWQGPNGFNVIVGPEHKGSSTRHVFEFKDDFEIFFLKYPDDPIPNQLLERVDTIEIILNPGVDPGDHIDPPWGTRTGG